MTGGPDGRTALRAGAAVVVVFGLLFGLYTALTGASLRPGAEAAPLPPAAEPVASPAETWAPVDRPGPALSVPAAELAASLQCFRGRTGRDTVLLLSGTGADPATAFGWGLQPVLTAQGYPVCLSTAPGRNTGDITVRAEYVVHAIRTIAAQTDRKVAVVGHSQGGVAVRWALRFWPDVRPQVSDVIGLAPPNAGAASLRAQCAQPCAAAFWQQAAGSAFETALNSRARTFPGIDYTTVVSTTDTVVDPVPQASALPPEPAGGAVAGDGAVAVQEICPGREVDHVALGLSDAVSLALVLDALARPGPADPARVPAATCGRVAAQGITAAGLRTGTAAVERELALPAASLPAEPPLPCYARSRPC